MNSGRIKIALAGNPNCGKTTLFNVLTGMHQYVGNWPGVTVEKKEGPLRDNDDVDLIDLPGIYSLSPYTSEEVVARNYLVGERPDAILNIIDASNLERNLYLTTQLLELGIPVVVALNMMDVVRRRGDKINTAELSRQIGCPVIEISALKGENVMAAAESAKSAAAAAMDAASHSRVVPLHFFSGPVEHAIAHIEEAALHDLPEERQRWYAVKIFERDPKVKEQLKLPPELAAHIEKDIAAAEREADDDAESIIINERYLHIAEMLKSCYVKKRPAHTMTGSDKIDRVLTNRILALPVFAAVMFVVYAISMGPIGTAATDWTNDVLVGAWIQPACREFLSGWGVAPWLVQLIADAIVGGVGAVIGFIPQMLILFTLLSILEDVGYMSRIAFILDRFFRKFGLSGKSFIPMLVASGCGVPGIMASRTIEQERDRKMTIMTTCFIPCSAKMPMIALIAGALFGGAAWVATAAYFTGIAAIVISGIILKKCSIFAGAPAPFVLELPSYHLPLLSNVLRTTFERGWSFIKRAGTVIVAAAIIIWLMQAFSFTGGFHFIGAGAEGQSILNLAGEWLSYLFRPLGFDAWQAAVATITGLVAKEQVVGTLGTLSSITGSAELEGVGTMERIGAEFFGGSRLGAFSFLIFNLLCAPCAAACGAIRREMNSARWALGAIAYMCGFAWVISFLVYQLGTAVAGKVWNCWTAAAAITAVVMLWLLFRKNPQEK